MQAVCLNYFHLLHMFSTAIVGGFPSTSQIVSDKVGLVLSSQVATNDLGPVKIRKSLCFICSHDAWGFESSMATRWRLFIAQYEVSLCFRFPN